MIYPIILLGIGIFQFAKRHLEVRRIVLGRGLSRPAAKTCFSLGLIVVYHAIFMIAGWWLTYPIFGKIKNVPNHQPD